MDVLFDILDEERKNRNKVPFFRVKRGLLLILCVHFFTTMSAQTDTTIIIKVVEVAATNIEKDGMGSVIQSFEAKTLDNYRGQALSQLLSEQGNIFIKSYGANTLATISMRGTGSNHTAVLWNGLNLQSSMNGSVDFNLVPVFFLEKIDLQKGGSSARYGSGAIGGSLHLNSYKKPENGWHGAVGGSLGSFEKVEALGKLSFAKENWNSTIKVINREAENDFPLLKNPNQKQTNAHFEQQGITNDNYLKINEKQFLKSFFWYQNVQRQIPPTRSEGASNAQQNDEFLRAGMEWSRVGDSDATKAKVAYLQDKLLFFSDMVDSANSLTKTAIVELEQDFYLKNSQTLRFGVQFQRRWAKADGFETNQLQYRTALWTSYQRVFFQEKLEWTTNLRQELVDESLIPFTGSTGTNWSIHPLFSLRIKISKNYNLPTFNDLFWAGGFGVGNKNLKPESGWSGEVGVDFEKAYKKCELKAGITVFNSTIENWILWQPTSSNWQPSNEREVQARGMETFFAAKYRLKDWEISAQLQYAYTKSTAEKINDGDNPRQLGKQLLYVPLHTTGGQLKIVRKNAFLSYQHQWVGKRQTTRDNNPEEAAPAYDTAELLLGYDFHIWHKKIFIQLTILNLWNEDYEVIVFRPMPGRSFDLGIKVEL